MASVGVKAGALVVGKILEGGRHDRWSNSDWLRRRRKKVEHGAGGTMEASMKEAEGGSSDYPRPGQSIPVLYHKRQITRK